LGCASSTRANKHARDAARAFSSPIADRGLTESTHPPPFVADESHNNTNDTESLLKSHIVWFEFKL
jgi:hypothetical protein